MIIQNQLDGDIYTSREPVCLTYPWMQYNKSDHNSSLKYNTKTYVCTN